jgi:hypothetical protein
MSSCTTVELTRSSVNVARAGCRNVTSGFVGRALIKGRFIQYERVQTAFAMSARRARFERGISTLSMPAECCFQRCGVTYGLVQQTTAAERASSGRGNPLVSWCGDALSGRLDRSFAPEMQLRSDSDTRRCRVCATPRGRHIAPVSETRNAPHHAAGGTRL